MPQSLTHHFSHLLAAALIWISGSPLAGGAEIVVDTETKLSTVERKPGGMLTCWLLDSDRERPRPTSMVNIYKQLGVQSVRFPYGHLTNNYLWTSPPYANAANGLSPRVASLSKEPAKWEWAVNPDGTFLKDLDFDEFMDQCRQANIEPVIVINVMAHKYPDGPTLDALREAAVEWVRYANVTRKYGVKYWQLGNEQEHHPKLMSLNEYKDIYNTFTNAMKAVDPSIHTGIAIINDRVWAETLLHAFPKQVDFIGCHQYQWEKWTVDAWIKRTAPMIPNALSIEKVIRDSPRPDAEIMITETSPQGKWHDGPGKPDIMRALCFAEMLLHYATIENLAYTHYWATHCPWSQEKADDGIASALTLDNELKPNATMIGLINHSLGSHMVQVERVVGSLRVFASHTAKDGTVVLYLINKSNKPVTASLNLKGISPQKIESRLVYSGTDYGDLNPKTTKDQEATIAGNTVTTTLPGISLTILTVR